MCVCLRERETERERECVCDEVCVSMWRAHQREKGEFGMEKGDVAGRRSVKTEEERERGAVREREREGGKGRERGF